MKKKFLVIVSVIFFISCKENKTKPIDNTKIDSVIVAKPKQKENFKVKLKHAVMDLNIELFALQPDRHDNLNP